MLRTLLVGDVQLYLSGLQRLLELTSKLDVVAALCGGHDASQRVSCHDPQVVLIDLAMRDGLVIVKSITRDLPATPVVALAFSESEHDLIACAEAGVAGYVAKEASLQELVAVVEAAVNGELHCSPRTSASLLRRVAKLARETTPAKPARVDAAKRLTAQERRVLEQLERGSSNKQIAVALGIEVTTAKNHVHNILEKLGVASRGEAAAHSRSSALCE